LFCVSSRRAVDPRARLAVPGSWNVAPHHPPPPLGDVFDPANVIVETLRTYFAAGENAVVTAQRLGVHSRTVAYRLRSAESKIGAHNMHRDELATALRIVPLVQAVPPAPGDSLPSPAL
ncbi:helix-turn-helix domain-containing protein, partial [Amycolatopsis sp. NPDC059090]|uniref:helix-turn-helix domain-containing protein n=1 Tax=Amycolatopsis sp. NPDC059090 TaxID=3346723 RepID=UPI00366BBB6D